MESKKSFAFIPYQKELKELLNKNLIDIIFFGSFVKGGAAKDVDIALVVERKKNLTKAKQKIKKLFEKKIDFQVIGLHSLYSPLWLTLIKEGYSIRKEQFLREIYKIEPKILYKYSLKKLNNVEKVQFERGLKKVLEGKGCVLTRTVILVPLEIKNKLDEFLKTWKIYYETQEYELLPFLRKEEFQ